MILPWKHRLCRRGDIARRLFCFGGAGVFALAAMRVTAQSIPTPPPALEDKTTDTIHGVQVADPYRWLEDSKSPQSSAWITAEQAYTASLLTGRPEMDGLRRNVHALADLEEAQRVLLSLIHI